jgi:hypothetical protein
MPLALPYFLESARGMELLGLVFSLWMLYECAIREKNSVEKVLWFLLILIPAVGPLIYFFVRIVKIRG